MVLVCHVILQDHVIKDLYKILRVGAPHGILLYYWWP